MSRPKGAYISSLAEQAQADLRKIKCHKVVMKLKAISAIAKLPAESYQFAFAGMQIGIRQREPMPA